MAGTILAASTVVRTVSVSAFQRCRSSTTTPGWMSLHSSVAPVANEPHDVIEERIHQCVGRPQRALRGTDGPTG